MIELRKVSKRFGASSAIQRIETDWRTFFEASSR